MLESSMKLKKILVVSKGLIHPSIICRYTLKNTLNEFKLEYSFTYINSFKNINESFLKKYDCVILYYHEKKIPEFTYESIYNYVNKGGKILAVHGSLASNKGNKKYEKLLGSKFSGHDAVTNIQIESTKTIKELDVNTFEIKDELYINLLDSNCNVIFQSTYQNKPVPIIWHKNQGEGKVVAFVPGHKYKTFLNPEIIKIIRWCLEFLTK